MTDNYLYRKLKQFTNRVEVDHYERNGARIRYVDVGVPENRTIIFIHGAPGSLNAFIGFLKNPLLLQHFRMIAVDRPGYGHSEKRKPFPSIRQQARMLLPLLEKSRNIKKPVLVGHSYGGPISAAMALESPGKTGGLVLIGAAMDPEHERIFWVSHLFSHPWISRLLPSSIYVTNVEKLEHVDELNKLKAEWDKIHVPVTIIHGLYDLIVPVKNAYFSQQMLTGSKTKLVVKKNAGHYIPWLQPGLIRKEILEMGKKG
jgi:pimeloyl-ACP methyl ester carboxylesterase